MTYKPGLYVLAAVFLVFLVMTLGTPFPRAASGYQFSMAVKLLKNPVVIVAALALFCYISLESSMNTWSKPYMTEMLGGDQNPNAVANAGLVLSLFGVAMMVGRFLTSTVKNLTNIGVKLIAAMAAVAAVAILTMIMTHSAALATAAVVLTGLAFAPIFPTIVGVTFAKFDSSLYGSIFGIIFAIGLLGATFVPKIIGNLSKGATIQQSLGIVLAMAVALFVVSWLLAWKPKSGAAK